MAERVRPIGTVLVLHDRPEDFRSELEARHPGIVFHWVLEHTNAPAALAAIRPDAVLAIRTTRFGGTWHREAALLPGVCWFHIGGSGYEHILPLPRPDLCLTHGRGVLAPFVAETIISAMLALNGQFLAYMHQQRRKIWRPRPFRSIAGQTLVIAGLGAIGVEVARRAKALGMRVLATRRIGPSDWAVDELHPPEKLIDLLGHADVLSVHARPTGATRHLIDANLLAAMKPNAVLINTSRGALVDEVALFAALDAGRLAAAYLDVFEQEPLPATSPLWERENLLVSPHNADGVVGWASHLASRFSENLQRWNEGRPLLDEITLDAGGMPIGHDSA
jgi:phosphoglycerate dehydrogenase-like enzyme